MPCSVDLDLAFLPAFCFSIATSSRLLHDCFRIQALFLRKIALCTSCLASGVFSLFVFSHLIGKEVGDSSIRTFMQMCGYVLVGYAVLACFQLVLAPVILCVEKAFLFLYCLCFLLILLGDWLDLAPLDVFFEEEINFSVRLMRIFSLVVCLSSLRIWLV
ncbi:hypothetical protein [Candidatus Similichlamydia laticola]|uniref:Uncharacterized protein n=1 Tax=Candidatus Similichlamydia laticola TaxID=2170265 RepID=A0A369KCP3_9BACT|nr:hypothetical protein [Candidatus Similichlamydia laticola]RDB31678.1 hypothetical protein HAT2_00186 [Candidatus Similichlamydia laticola]